MIIWNEIKKIVHYLQGKASEIQDIDVKDVMLAKVVLDIHRKRTHTEFIMVPLFAVKQIHSIDRDNALLATERRVETLSQYRDKLLETKQITRAILAEYLPSISWIKVVKENNTSYIAYEGNGRLVAMQQVFKPEDEILVEVEIYHFRNQKKILRRMNRVRRMNGLI